jgi:uncharacterized protein YdaT
MPWSRSIIPTSFNGLKGDDISLAISIANGVLKQCISEGGNDADCAPKAIRIALGKVKERKMKESAVEAAATATSNDSYTITTNADSVDVTTIVAAPVSGDHIATSGYSRVVESAIREDLSFDVSLDGANISEEDGIVRVPAILVEAGWSKNNRYYKTALLRKLAVILEGAGSFDSHLDKPRVTDYIGVHRNVSLKEKAGPTGRDALTSSFEIIDPRLQRLARHAPHLIKLSIQGKGDLVRGSAEGRDGWIVEDVDPSSNWTCDVVVRAGARGGIGAVLEAMDEGASMEITSLQDLKKTFPALLKEYADEVSLDATAQAETNALKTQLKESNDELANAVKARDEATQRVKILESREVLEKKLAESKLPDALVKRVRGQFKDRIAEDAAIEEAVNDARELVKDLSAEVKVEGVKETKDMIEESSDADADLLFKVLGVKEGDA